MNRQFDNVLLGSIELFCLAAQHESFSIAARLASVTPAAVSRAIGRLELRLKTRLFMRSTRQIRLTEAGTTYFYYCQSALAELRDAENEISGQTQALSGLIRVSMPTTYAHYRIPALFAKFQTQFPEINFDLHISNRNIDFLDEGYDLAIRGRTPPDSNIIARKLEDADLVVVASPHYLKQYGIPENLAALSQHNCIQFELPSTGKKIPWLFNQQGVEVDLPVFGNLTCLEDVLGGVTLAKVGAGIFQTYRFIVESDLQSGNLVEILQNYSGRSRPFSLLYPQRRLLPLRVRAFIDFLIASLNPKQ